MNKGFSLAFVTVTSLVFIIAGIQPYAVNASGPSGLSNLVKNSFQEAGNAAGLKPSTNDLSVLDLFGLYVAVALGFIGVLFLVQVVHGGILWMSAGGNEEQITHARKKILNAGIGAAIVFACFVFTVFIMTQIATTVGVQF
ncbi:MAG: hypothetical protein WC817_01525 [Patescibacteria group bacterium]